MLLLVIRLSGSPVDAAPLLPSSARGLSCRLTIPALPARVRRTLRRLSLGRRLRRGATLRSPPGAYCYFAFWYSFCAISKISSGSNSGEKDSPIPSKSASLPPSGGPSTTSSGPLPSGESPCQILATS